MKAQLLIARQAGNANAAKRTQVEGVWRIVELTAAEVGLAAVPGCVENHWVNVDPTTALSDQLDTNRSPVSLHAIAPARQNAQRHRLVSSVQREVKVTVQPRLPTNQSIDTPTASDPNGATGLGQVRQHPKHLTKIHALVCSLGLFGLHHHLRSHHSRREARSPSVNVMGFRSEVRRF
jgi:hypothetical protein